MATDLALVTVLIQLLLDMVMSDNIDFYNLMPAVESECVFVLFICFIFIRIYTNVAYLHTTHS